MSALSWLSHQPLSTYAIPFYAVGIGLEVSVLSKKRTNNAIQGYEPRDTLASLSMGVISLPATAVIGLGTIGLYQWAWNHRLDALGSGAFGWIVALVGWDFLYYWNHRANHRMRILWANHVQHHSSRRYNFSTALRQPVTSVFEWVFFIPLAIAGVPLKLIAVSGAISLIYQFMLHTEAIDRLPDPIEIIFNTPSHHRVHHGSNSQYLDKNYGGILIIWDRLFGSFEAEVEPVVYGLTKNINSFNPAVIACHEYIALARAVRTTPGISGKVRRILLGPGWEPSPEL
ncbi:MAG TPA: sterol desaturase family protein [Acidimicrobiales bacterium]|nr:sterol desaturase family protein [Acidimicrobiales bacterium]